jgi:hypothetical protein
MQLDKAQADGQPLRAHLAAAAQHGGQADPRLTRRVPRAGTALWDLYGTLNACRPPSMGGVVCVPPSEILAWQQLHGVALTPWEVETLMAMDRAAVAAYHAKDTPQ